MLKLRGLAAAAIALASFCVASARAAGPAAAPTEWDVKAAYLYNFTRFVDWPAQAPADAPFVVGVLGADPFGRALDEALLGKTVAGRPVLVRRLERPEDAASVQLLYLASPADRDAARALRAAEGRPVLTVSEAEGSARKGVILAFRVRDNRVRFEVNLPPAAEAGLRISSQLLKLALAVEGR